MVQWRWVSDAAALAAHREQLAEHGGPDGVRDVTLLESAMGRPKNLATYGEPDAAALAASYAFGLARNHPFVDGNKRTAAVVCEGFLNLNGMQLDCTNAEMAVLFQELAAGEISEAGLAAWLRERVSPA